MEIRPSDLGSSWALGILQKRTAQTAAGRRRGSLGRSGVAQSSTPGLLTRFWLGNTNLNAAEAREAMKIVQPYLGGFVGGFGGGSMGFIMPAVAMVTNGHPELAAVFGLLGLGFLSLGVGLPRFLFQKWYTEPITPAEVEALSSGPLTDDLERSFLSLLQNAIQRDNVPEAAAESVKTALRALGDAIDRLPAGSGTEAGDPSAYCQQAQEVLASAQKETDPVVAASRARQAEALLRSARAAEQSAQVMRRVQALRDEIAAQTEALRLGLTAFYSGAGDPLELSRLAEEVRSVAQEAGHVAQARQELDGFLEQSLPANALPGERSLPAPGLSDNPQVVSAGASSQAR